MEVNATNIISADVEQTLGTDRIKEIAGKAQGYVAKDAMGDRILTLIAVRVFEQAARYMITCDLRRVADPVAIWSIVSETMKDPGFDSRFILGYLPRIKIEMKEEGKM